MNSQYENASLKGQRKNSTIEALMQRNAEAIQELSLIPYETQVYAIPVEQRSEEMNLLAAAVEFQPELYRLIAGLATRRELAEHSRNVAEIMTDHMEEALTLVEGQCRATTASVREIISQDGKARERFISDCTSRLNDSRRQLERTVDKLEVRLRWILIGTGGAAVLLSLLVSWLFWKLAG